MPCEGRGRRRGDPWGKRWGEEIQLSDDRFWTEVRNLPERQAQAVALHYLEDLPVAEIAEILVCAPGTVKVHLHRGRRALAAALGMTVTEDSVMTISHDEIDALPELDRRARAAVGELHDAVADRVALDAPAGDLPTAPPTPPITLAGGRLRKRGLLAAAAAVIVVATAASVVALRDDRASDVASGRPGRPAAPRLAAGGTHAVRRHRTALSRPTGAASPATSSSTATPMPTIRGPGRSR